VCAQPFHWGSHAIDFRLLEEQDDDDDEDDDTNLTTGEAMGTSGD